MSNKADKIFSNTSCPTEDILLKYVKGTLNEKDSRAIEEHLTDCEMCNDEIEGLSLLSNPEDIEDIVFKINTKIDIHIKAEKKRDYGFFFKIAATVILVFGLSAIVYYQVNNSKKQELISENIVNEPLGGKDEEKITDSVEIFKNSNLNELQAAGEEKELMFVEEADVSEDLPIMTFAQLQKETEILKNTEAKQPIASDDLQSTTITGIIDGTAGYTEYRPVTVTGDIISDKSAAKDETVSNKDAERNSGDISGGVKTISTSPESKKIDLALISGKKEKSKESRNEKDNRKDDNDGELGTPATGSTAVAEVLEAPMREESNKASVIRQEAVEKAKKDQFGEAIILFESAPDQSTNDETALFYEALSNYKLNNPQRALAILKVLIKNNKLELYNDVKWYYALTLISLNKKADAEKVLKEIVKSNSPYAANASLELEKLK